MLVLGCHMSEKETDSKQNDRDYYNLFNQIFGDDIWEFSKIVQELVSNTCSANSCFIGITGFNGVKYV